MTKLKAPHGVGSEIKVEGFSVPIVHGIIEIPPHHVETLRSHGFTLVEGEDALVRGSRAAMVARFLNDARAFADTMSDEHLAAYTDMATTKLAEVTQSAWHTFADGIRAHQGRYAKPNGISEDDQNGAYDAATGGEPGIDHMSRIQLFAHLKERGLPVTLTATNEELRAAARTA